METFATRKISSRIASFIVWIVHFAFLGIFLDSRKVFVVVVSRSASSRYVNIDDSFKTFWSLECCMSCFVAYFSPKNIHWYCCWFTDHPCIKTLSKRSASDCLRRQLTSVTIWLDYLFKICSFSTIKFAQWHKKLLKYVQNLANYCIIPHKFA